MTVISTVIGAGVDFSVGRMYDNAGSVFTWVLILGAVLLSAGSAVILKARDKKAYPKLYKAK